MVSNDFHAASLSCTCAVDEGTQTVHFKVSAWSVVKAGNVPRLVQALTAICKFKPAGGAYQVVRSDYGAIACKVTCSLINNPIDAIFNLRGACPGWFGGLQPDF